MNLEHDEIVVYLDKLDREAKAFKDEALRFTWWMRGGVTYDEAVQLGQTEREIINKLIEENMEATKKSGLPFF